MVLEEGGVKLSLTIVDTPGFGDKVTIVMMLMMLMMLMPDDVDDFGEDIGDMLRLADCVEYC